MANESVTVEMHLDVEFPDGRGYIGNAMIEVYLDPCCTGDQWTPSFGDEVDAWSIVGGAVIGYMADDTRGSIAIKDLESALRIQLESSGTMEIFEEELTEKARDVLADRGV